MSTPALARATEATRTVPLADPESTEKYSARLARAVVSAALHDPDDPDALARSICDATEGWEHSDQTDDHPCTRCKTQADAVRAAILGEA